MRIAGGGFALLLRSANCYKTAYRLPLAPYPMFQAPPNLLTNCLVLTAAVGVSLAGFVSDPPCHCGGNEPEQQAAACPHCQPSVAAPSGCATAACCQQGDCDCPCCEGSPVDQPLIMLVEGSLSPTDISDSLFFSSCWTSFDLPTAMPATGGWRRAELWATTSGPRLAKLCRWLI